MKNVAVSSYLKLFLMVVVWAILIAIVFWLFKQLGLGEPIQLNWATKNTIMEGYFCRGLKLFGITLIQISCQRI